LNFREIAGKARLLKISARRHLNRHFNAGEFRSKIKGAGIEFSEIRPYAWGDDTRYMDWNVSARLGFPNIKIFESSREQSIVIALDVSASMREGPIGTSIHSVATEMAAVLACSAYLSQNSIGILIFSEQVEKYIAPGRGRHRLQQIFKTIEGYKAKNQKTDYAKALEFLARRVRHGSVLYMLSDFADFQSADVSALFRIGKRHELNGIRIINPMVSKIPNSGIWSVCHPENGSKTWIDFGSSTVRAAYLQQIESNDVALKSAFSRSGHRLIEVTTNSDWFKKLKLTL
jgi:uncharacterized protein (DUF58 family)